MQEELAEQVGELKKKLGDLEKKLNDNDSMSPEEDERLRRKIGDAQKALQRAKQAMEQASKQMSGGQSPRQQQDQAQEDLSKAAEALAEFRTCEPDLGVVVAFGQFLPKEIREAPARGYMINGHASLLPRYRGAAPISRCILDGATVTGVSAMRVEREMDSGAIALQREIEIGEHENAGDLSERLAKLTADALEEVIEQMKSG